jgi:hypothetical protein
VSREREIWDAVEAVIRALPPAPRVVVLDHWQLLSKSGAVSEVGITSAADAEEARVYHDATWPADAPHRVVRVALVEEGVPEVRFGNVPPRVVVTEAMVERAWAKVEASCEIEVYDGVRLAADFTIVDLHAALTAALTEAPADAD